MSNGAGFVKIHVHEHTGTLILNRPEKRNALTRAGIAELIQALDDLRRERRVRAVVISASGSAFCAGMDLHEMQQTAAAPNAQELWHEDAVAYRELIEAMLRLPKPIIATVGGPAVAGGAGLVLASDIVSGGPGSEVRSARAEAWHRRRTGRAVVNVSPGRRSGRVSALERPTRRGRRGVSDWAFTMN